MELRPRSHLRIVEVQEVLDFRYTVLHHRSVQLDLVEQKADLLRHHGDRPDGNLVGDDRSDVPLEVAHAPADLREHTPVRKHLRPDDRAPLRRYLHATYWDVVVARRQVVPRCHVPVRDQYAVPAIGRHEVVDRVFRQDLRLYQIVDRLLERRHVVLLQPRVCDRPSVDQRIAEGVRNRLPDPDLLGVFVQLLDLVRRPAIPLERVAVEQYALRLLVRDDLRNPAARVVRRCFLGAHTHGDVGAAVRPRIVHGSSPARRVPVSVLDELFHPALGEKRLGETFAEL